MVNNNQYQIPQSYLREQPARQASSPLQAPPPLQPPVQPQMPPETVIQRPAPETYRRVEPLRPPIRQQVERPERQPSPLYLEIHERERDIESFRESATEKNLHKSLAQKVIDSIIEPSKPLMTRLIDEESLYGGYVLSHEPFKMDKSITMNRFWYFEGHWYYEMQHDQHGEIIVSYQVAPDAVYKTVNGIATSFVPGEVDSFRLSTKLYHDVVRQEMYPVDDAIAMLKEEENEDERPWFEKPEPEQPAPAPVRAISARPALTLVDSTAAAAAEERIVKEAISRPMTEIEKLTAAAAALAESADDNRLAA